MNVEELVERQLAGKTEVLEELASLPLSPSQIAHDLTWNQTQANAVGNGD